MTKEMIISSNRHETRVALLEDDQLVELAFQRANEYSLAGSIHKGRVTRVLPGMQSAFVNLGLERDTFLYVSDFFEEHEEFDSVDDVRARPVPVAQPVSFEPIAAVEIEEAPEPQSAQPAPEAAPPAQSTPEPRFQDDRRNRRGRKRRQRGAPGGGRGFPDSKYAPAGVARTETTAEPAEVATDIDEDYLTVLPGESISKYRGSGPADEESPNPAASVHVLSPDSEADHTTPIEEDEEPVAALAPPPTEAADDEDPLSDAAYEAAYTAVENLDESSEEDSADDEPGEEENVVESLEDDAAESFEEESSVDSAIEESEIPVEAGELELGPASLDDSDERSGDSEAEVLTSEDVDPRAESVLEPRTEEPAKAAHREQGGRFMHRLSRRQRRRRGGDGRDARGEAREGREVREGREPREARDGQSETREIAAAAPPQRSPQGRPPLPNRGPVRGDRPPQPLITDLLKEGQEILVQIAKEPLGQKGARITSHIALPGRYVVYMPTVEHLGVSRKIGSEEERQRLKRILLTHREGIPGGFIMRTAGEGKSEEDIASDMNFLYHLWMDIRQKAEKLPAPALIHHDLDIVQRILRDQLTEAFKSIWVDNEEMYESVLRFVQRFQPALVNRVRMYTRPEPIFDAFNVTSELEKALRPKVWLKSGGYIVINQTEALVAIDINTGKFVGKSNRLEDTIVKTNLEAVKEIVRQIRLRDLGGIIVVDFIDMDERKNRQRVMQALEEAMRLDRAPNKILQFNDFGLVAITRKRVKQSLERALCSPCPYCEGAAYVKSVQTVISEILVEAHKMAKALEGEKNVVLRVHPEVAKALKSTENQYLEELEGILRRTVLVKGDPALHHEKFDLV